MNRRSFLSLSLLSVIAGKLKGLLGVSTKPADTNKDTFLPFTSEALGTLYHQSSPGKFYAVKARDTGEMFKLIDGQLHFKLRPECHTYKPALVRVTVRREGNNDK